MVKAKALVSFSSTDLGNITVGQTIEIGENVAREMVKAGMVECKAIDQVKKPESKPARLSQAGRATSKPKAKPSKMQDKDASLKCSESTQADSQQTVITSTQQTGDGGKSTTPKPKRKRASGRRTTTRRTSSD